MGEVRLGKRLWSRLHDLPLRYRLIVPFFLLALLGTTSLVWLAIRSEGDLVHRYERTRLFSSYKAFLQNIDVHGQWAISLAANFAKNPEVAKAMAERNRERLLELCYPAYLFMAKNFQVRQFHFQTIPPRSFLRLHQLYQFGDDLGYRQTIRDAILYNKEVFGLEKGLTGYGIRGVAPIYDDGRMVGTVEVGFAFGSIFLEQMKSQFDVDASVLLPENDRKLFSTWATTLPKPFERKGPLYDGVFAGGDPQMEFRDSPSGPLAVLIGQIPNYRGKTVGLVELSVSRAPTLSVIAHYRVLMLVVGLIGLLLSVGAIYCISYFFSSPIARMVTFAKTIATEDESAKLDVQPSGELGVLAGALNDMLTAIARSRTQLRDWAENLEQMVHLRTRALRESEEKYRTVVENVPIVVYRLLGNGKTIFINHFIQDLTGISATEALHDTQFWKKKVMEEDRERVWPLMELCLNQGREFKAEYRMCGASGKTIFVLDHALPVLDEKGNVETVDGFLVNVTDRYKLQQQILQTEELRTLSEISARLAHEIRNPLAAAGGFARRLLHTLNPEDPQREKVQIIVSEIARLEKILERTLAYLKPFEVVKEEASLNDLIESVLAMHERTIMEHSVAIRKDFSPLMETAHLDPVLIERALDSVVRGVIAFCQPGANVEFRTYPAENSVNLDVVVDGAQISDDDVEHFFYPFTSRIDPTLMIDLPLAKMIIHKHKGIIQLQRKNASRLVMTVSLPQ
ncbi:MAG: cache domain-containing protein [Syntrophobacteraceae bacterium]